MHSFLARYGTTTKFLMGHAQFCCFDDGPRKTRLAATMHVLADPTSFYLRHGISIRADYTMGKDQAAEHMQRLFVMLLTSTRSWVWRRRRQDWDREKQLAWSMRGMDTV